MEYLIGQLFHIFIAANPKDTWWLDGEPSCHGTNCGIIIRATWTGGDSFHYGLLARDVSTRAKRVDIRVQGKIVEFS